MATNNVIAPHFDVHAYKLHDSSFDCLKPKFKSFSKIAVKSPGPDLHHFFACLGLHPQILIWDQ